MKLKLTWLMTLFMACVMSFSYAQEKTVTGTVTTSEDGLPLPGASVIVKGTSRGQQTDFDGKYSIQVSQGETLVFSYVGSKTREQTVGTGNEIDVALKPDNQLQEVVVRHIVHLHFRVKSNLFYHGFGKNYRSKSQMPTLPKLYRVRLLVLTLLRAVVNQERILISIYVVFLLCLVTPSLYLLLMVFQ